MQEPLGAALDIGLLTIAGRPHVAVVVTRRGRVVAPARECVTISGALPILRIPRSAGEAALRAHELDPNERPILEAMGAGVQQLPDTADAARDLAAACDNVAVIGAAHGLDRDPSIAFRVRTTFSRFEAADGGE